ADDHAADQQATAPGPGDLGQAVELLADVGDALADARHARADDGDARHVAELGHALAEGADAGAELADAGVEGFLGGVGDPAAARLGGLAGGGDRTDGGDLAAGDRARLVG